MTITNYALRRISVYEEPDGSFAVDHSGTPGDFLAVPAQAGMSMTLDRPMVDPNLLQQYKHGRSTKVHGPRAATVTMTIPLGITGTLADASTATLDNDDSALFRLLKICMGGLRAGHQGSTVDSAANAYTITVATGEGSQFTAGGAIGWVNSSSQMEIVPIQSVSTDTLVLKHALSGTPSASDVIYNATTAYLDDSATHAQFIVEGAEADDMWSVRGMQLSSLGFGVAMGELSTLQLTMQGAEWEYKGSGSLAGQTYSNYVPQAFNAGYFLAQAEATPTRNAVSVANVALSSGLTYTPVRAPGGTNTVLRYLQAHQPPVASGSFQTYYEDQTWFTAWLNRTLYNLCLQIGRVGSGTGAGGILIECAGAQLGPVTAPEDANGITASTVPFECGIDGNATSQTTAIRRSPIRCHFVG